MADNSKIEWTDASWNPLLARDLVTGKLGWHCELASEGCKHCYAQTLNGRMLPHRGTGHPYTRSSRDKVEMLLHDPTLCQPFGWRRPRMIFVCSMTDLFGEFVPFQLIDQMMAVMASCRRHTFQVLTKRPERALQYFTENPWNDVILRVLQLRDARPLKAPYDWLDGFASVYRITEQESAAGKEWPGRLPLRWPLPNVWIGTSVENQKWADVRIDQLVQCPAWLHYVSYEPALGGVDFSRWLLRAGRQLDWIIAGGESGRDGSPAHPDWFRSARDQCVKAGAAFFFKQWGQWWPKHPVYGDTDRVDRFEDADEHPNSKWVEHTETVLQRNGFQPCGMTRDEHWIHHQPEPQQNPWWFLYTGKKTAGRLLDGQTWDQMPKVAHG